MRSQGGSMANKASFTTDEWNRIFGSPMVVGMAVTASDPSGLWGLLKEGMAGGWAMLEARQSPQSNELVKAVATDVATPETRDAARQALQAKFKVNDIGEIKSKAIEELRAVGALLDAKAPSDAAAFKVWLRDIAQKTAEAASEGGFLGFGGVPVSDAETATITEIASALNAPSGARH
jgi:hypothetical protein